MEMLFLNVLIAHPVLRVTPRILLRHAISNTFSSCLRSVSLSRFWSYKEGSSRQVSHILVILLPLYLLLTKPFLVPGTQSSLFYPLLDVRNRSPLRTEASSQVDKVDCLFEILILDTSCKEKVYHEKPSAPAYLTMEGVQVQLTHGACYLLRVCVKALRCGVLLNAGARLPFQPFSHLLACSHG